MTKKGGDREYFFDRNPEIFDVIMDFYRTKQILLPKHISIESLMNELEFFGIDVDEDGISYRNRKR
jgi:hypothetical protein